MSISARFRRADRMVSGGDYRRVRRLGRRVSARHFTISIAAREFDLSNSVAGSRTRTRLGLIVSRKVGNAVMRNRVKRAVREWFRTTGIRMVQDADIVVIARRGAASEFAEVIQRELSLLVVKGRVAKKPGARE